LIEAMPVELSVVIPCLNEADTLEACIRKAQEALRQHDIAGEIIVADNGSADASRDIALRMGARVIDVEARGYGAALMGGIAAARGEFIVMGDADDSYDFRAIPEFLAKLRQGFELAQGCRLPAGGGRAPCPRRTGGWAIRSSRRWPAICSGPPCTTSTVACAASRRSCTSASISAALAWSSRPR
jgi:glycosyltransferase involved in cell wall biosynthesis